MRKAYEQLYAQQHRQISTPTLNKSIKDEISLPVNDLYPVSVVPYDFEPQPLHLYQIHNTFNGDKHVDRRYRPDDIPTYDEVKSSKDTSQGYISDDSEENLNLNSNSNKSSKPNNNRKPDDRVVRSGVDDTINKLDTLVSIANDGRIKLVTSSDSKNNLDRNMNLLNNP